MCARLYGQNAAAAKGDKRGIGCGGWTAGGTRGGHEGWRDVRDFLRGWTVQALRFHAGFRTEDQAGRRFGRGVSVARRKAYDGKKSATLKKRHRGVGTPTGSRQRNRRARAAQRWKQASRTTCGVNAETGCRVGGTGMLEEASAEASERARVDAYWERAGLPVRNVTAKRWVSPVSRRRDATRSCVASRPERWRSRPNRRNFTLAVIGTVRQRTSNTRRIGHV